jgi:hypothetical protein
MQWEPGWAPRDSGVWGGTSGGARGGHKSWECVWRVGLTIEGEHWVCSAGFKERQTEISCNESPPKTPGTLGVG